LDTKPEIPFRKHTTIFHLTWINLKKNSTYSNLKVIAKVIAILMIFALVLGTLVFKVTSSFVSSFDGDNSTDMDLIEDRYFFSESDFSIWKLETKGSYLRISSKIDTIAWNSESIFYFSNSKYYQIKIRENRAIEIGLKPDKSFLDARSRGFMRFLKIPAWKPSIVKGD
jgi:hypothetical protein